MADLSHIKIMELRSVETYKLALISRFESHKRIKQGENWVNDPSGAKEWKTKYTFVGGVSLSEHTFFVKEDQIKFEQYRDKTVYLVLEAKTYQGLVKAPTLVNLIEAREKMAGK